MRDNHKLPDDILEDDQVEEVNDDEQGDGGNSDEDEDATAGADDFEESSANQPSQQPSAQIAVTAVGKTVVLGSDIVYQDDEEDDNEPPDDADVNDVLTNLEFENSPWEIEMTEIVLKWFKKHQKKQPDLVNRVVAKLRQLADGRWDYCQRKQLRGVYADMQLYEAKLSKGARIMWELGITFSERRSSAGAIYTQSIRVWSVVLDHDKINNEIAKICEAHRRGRGSHLRRKLRGVSKDDDALALKKGTVVTPRTFAPADVVQGGDDGDHPDASHYPPASWQSNQYTLLKFYDMSSTIANALTAHGENLSLEEMKAFDFPFKVTDKEFEVINATGNDGKRQATVLIGVFFPLCADSLCY